MADKSEKRNFTAWVPGEFHKRVKDFIKKENAKPGNLGIKMKIREFLIKASDEYIKNHGG